MYKVMIVDDMPKHRERIGTVVSQIPGHSILVSLEDGDKVIHWFYNRNELPDIILLDIEMKRMDGVSVMEYLNDFFPSIKVIALSSHHDEYVVKDILAAGAKGFVWKHDDYRWLKEAIEEVKNGNSFIDKRVIKEPIDFDELIQKRRREKEILHEDYKFTDREWQIMKIIISNINYIEIGSILNITQRTVETYVTRLNKKLDIVNGRYGLHNFSISRGIGKIARLSKLKK